MTYRANTKFVALCREVAQKGKSERMTVRELLGYFGQERRGSEVVRYIKNKLRYLGVETKPRFDQVHIDAVVEILKRQNGSRSSTAHEQQVFYQTTISTPPSAVATGIPPAVDTDNPIEERLPYLPIGLLIPPNFELQWVRGSDSLDVATTLMIMHNISYVPVLQGGRGVEGVVTWRTVGKAQAGNRATAKASDCMERNVHVVRRDAPLFDAVRDVIEHGVVLVQAEDRTICGVVTATEVAQQFKVLAEPFLFLEQIENHLRSLLRKAKLSQEELRSLVNPVDEGRITTIKTVDDLTFGEYINGLGQPDVWARLKLRIDRQMFTSRLDSIRKIRNKVMHFHPDGISAEDREMLERTRVMLQNF